MPVGIKPMGIRVHSGVLVGIGMSLTNGNIMLL